MAQQSSRIVTDDAMGGLPRIEGHRVTVLDVVELVEERGLDAGTVADRFGLEVAAVYHALAYHHDHPAEMRDARAKREAVIDEHRERGLRPDDVREE